MSLILSSTAAPGPSGKPPSSAAARSDAQGEHAPGSFGEALSRSRAPAEEKTETSAARAAPGTPARRQTGAHKTHEEDLLNAMALSFVTLETQIAKAAPLNGAGSAGTQALAGSTAAALTGLVAGTPLPADEAMAATAVATDAHAPPALALSGQQDAAQATVPGKPRPATLTMSGIVTSPPDPGKTTEQAVPAGFRGPSSPGDENAADTPDDASAGMTRTGIGSTTKMAPGAALPGVETAALSPTGTAPPPPDAEPLSTSASAVLPGVPANAATQGAPGISTVNAPAPVNTASLSVEVGSSEWGKALGHQVIQMSTAGHQVAELQLNPPGLGPLKVTLSMNDHQIQAMFVSAHSSVRAAVEAALPQLRSSLADSGISLGNTSVSADSQPQTAFAQSQSGPPEQRRYRTGNTVTTDAPAARPATEPQRARNGINVDTYA